MFALDGPFGSVGARSASPRVPTRNPGPDSGRVRRDIICPRFRPRVGLTRPPRTGPGARAIPGSGARRARAGGGARGPARARERGGGRRAARGSEGEGGAPRASHLRAHVRRAEILGHCEPSATVARVVPRAAGPALPRQGLVPARQAPAALVARPHVRPPAAIARALHRTGRRPDVSRAQGFGEQNRTARLFGYESTRILMNTGALVSTICVLARENVRTDL